MKLLLIDDDVFLRDMYGKKFTDSGHEVEVAEGATSALSKIRLNQDFDMIILDMVMPGVTGAELIRTIKQDFPKMKAKCVVLSNQVQDDNIKEARLAGAAGYIIKAETVPSDVVKKVEALLNK